MKVSIIGSTGHYGYVLNGIRDDREIKIVGISPGSEGENISSLYNIVAKDHPYVKTYDDYCKMLDELKPDIAVVCCYFGDHAKVAAEVLRRGIHLFIEKPIATNMEDLYMLKEIYSKSGVFLATMFGIRYTPWFLTAWEAVKKGKIGEIRLMNAQKSYKLGNRGEHYKDRKTYGGTIPWVGSHAIDWLYWFSAKKFILVYSSHSNLFNKGHGDLEITALCHFVMENQVFASVTIDYMRPDTAKGHDDDRIRIVGTEGILEVCNRKVYLVNKETEGTVELDLLEGREIFQDFLKQVRSEEKCMISAEDSFYVTEACIKARMSADENRVVYF
ncbi:MAG: Gfo/Idh/MocA family oxidoreductase [Firmicutes bacterium]|nr:Gfo/Idh/MocA family oxidoreductase [Bacillota bacterium]